MTTFVVEAQSKRLPVSASTFFGGAGSSAAAATSPPGRHPVGEQFVTDNLRSCGASVPWSAK